MLTKYIISIPQLLALVSFKSISYVKENLRGLRENLKHKISPQVAVGRQPFQLNPTNMVSGAASAANEARARVRFLDFKI